MIYCNNNKYNCYASLKLDYLNQYINNHLLHHKIKMKKINNNPILLRSNDILHLV